MHTTFQILIAGLCVLAPFTLRAEEAPERGHLHVHVNLAPPGPLATNDIRQFYPSTNLLIELESVRSVWPKDYVPKLIVQRVRDAAVLAPSMVLAPLDGVFDIHNATPDPQLILGRNTGMRFHSYTLPGVVDRRKIRHKGMLELAALTPDEPHAVVYTTGSLHRMIPSGGGWRMENLSAGTHSVKVFHPAYKAQRRTVTVNADLTTHLHVELRELRPIELTPARPGAAPAQP